MHPLVQKKPVILLRYASLHLNRKTSSTQTPRNLSPKTAKHMGAQAAHSAISTKILRVPLSTALRKPPRTLAYNCCSARNLCASSYNDKGATSCKRSALNPCHLQVFSNPSIPICWMSNTCVRASLRAGFCMYLWGT